MTVLAVSTMSEVLDTPVEFTVLHPQATVAGPFHVLFLLHGLWGCHTDWLRKSMVEVHIGDLPLIVVMPDAGRSFYSEPAFGPQVGNYVGVELPKMVRSMFHVREPYCISGLSMGGYGAMRLALSFPETFVSAVSHSGAVRIGMDQTPSPEFDRLLGVVPGTKHDLTWLAEQAGARRPKLYLDCGTEDHLLEANRKLDKVWTKAGIQHQYVEHPGAHDWAYWNGHFLDGLAFHRKNLGF